tara:strand:+ start:6876 stop:7214 length:339 start_codon:yes stop_codon:yes gene_type:complete
MKGLKYQIHIVMLLFDLEFNHVYESGKSQFESLGFPVNLFLPFSHICIKNTLHDMIIKKMHVVIWAIIQVLNSQVVKYIKMNIGSIDKYKFAFIIVMNIHVIFVKKKNLIVR